jgi:pyruvate dehydrogenase E2 component (dihydrolipoamide acetyltransferase)
VQPGDEVHRGDIVALIDTDKADIEVEIFFDGVIEELLVPVGAHVPVGTPLARVRTGAEGAPSEAAVEPPVAEPAAAPGHDPHSPVLRRLARHLGVDLDLVTGTGPGGRVTREDVERAAGGATAVASTEPAATAPPTPRPEEPERDRAGAMRQAIAALMARSKREIPHYYVSTPIDMSTSLAWLERTNAERPLAERLLPAALLLKAAALTARDHPELNGFWIDDHLQRSEAVHLGVAVSLRGGGLVAPAIQHADQLDLAMLMAALRDLVQRARAGRLRSSEMSSPTLTVTNLGDQGVEVVQGVIYPPQVALLGLGRVAERPWAEQGMLGVRPVLTATLAADHRATDGHLGARFLSTFDRYLQHPEDL